MPSNPNAPQVVILAAGQGKRMHSDLPKVLHPLGGRPLLSHVLSAARSLSPSKLCVVIGHGSDRVRAAIRDADIAWAMQDKQLGTGHAVMQALPELSAEGAVLVLYGDVPLIARETLRSLLDAANGGALALLTQHVENPKGYGRIVRDESGRVACIVEEKDATAQQRHITEVNTGILAVARDRLDKWLSQLRNDNAQGEYYLTDIVAAAVQEGLEIAVRHPAQAHECLGVNSKTELAFLERRFQQGVAEGLLTAGVTLADPARIDVRGTLRCGRDVSIDVGCVFEGEVEIRDGARIGPYCVIRDCEIGAGTQVNAYTHIEEARIGGNARIGPYARIRPGTKLGDDVHIGNFVEVKASEFGRGSKANHLTYVGDSSVGRDVNIGAGTITCNYDGANKHRTIIEDDVHVGSDVQLVAPVTVGRGATIGAGTTVFRDVPPGALTLNPKKQEDRPGWKRPRKSR